MTKSDEQKLFYIVNPVAVTGPKILPSISKIYMDATGTEQNITIKTENGVVMTIGLLKDKVPNVLVKEIVLKSSYTGLFYDTVNVQMP